MIDRYADLGIKITVKENVYAALCRKARISLYGAGALDVRSKIR
jgi:hypothetical protein